MPRGESGGSMLALCADGCCMLVVPFGSVGHRQGPGSIICSRLSGSWTRRDHCRTGACLCWSRIRKTDPIKHRYVVWISALFRTLLNACCATERFSERERDFDPAGGFSAEGSSDMGLLAKESSLCQSSNVSTELVTSSTKTARKRT